MVRVPEIREALLEAVKAEASAGLLQQVSVLQRVQQQFRASDTRLTPELQAAILTQWGDLFRTGLLAWGLDFANPNPPFFHLTERGREALNNFERDPSNPAGYLRRLASRAEVGPVALSYVREALDCFVDGHMKAAAVMVGGAAEATVLDLRDAVVARLQQLSKQVPKDLSASKIKTVTDAVYDLFESCKDRMKQSDRMLWESLEGYWSAFAHQIRATRNEAGHPKSVDPVTPETVHASLLLFPELARLACNLTKWVQTSFS